MEKNEITKIKLPRVRLSFPSLFTKAQFNGEETKYEATFLLDKVKHKAQIDEISAQIQAMIKSELKGQKIQPDKICLRDGDNVEYDGYEGHMSFKASSNKRPLVINRADKSVVTEEDNIVYAGCYVNAIVSLWAQDNSWGKRINGTLIGVEFVADGEPFSSGNSGSVNDFDDFEDDDDDFSF